MQKIIQIPEIAIFSLRAVIEIGCLAKFSCQIRQCATILGKQDCCATENTSKCISAWDTNRTYVNAHWDLRLRVLTPVFHYKRKDATANNLKALSGTKARKINWFESFRGTVASYEQSSPVFRVGGREIREKVAERGAKGSRGGN